MIRLLLMLAVNARDGDRQRTLSQQIVRNERRAALPSREAKRPFQRQRACVNKPSFFWFRMRDRRCNGAWNE
jgi:hypothetical protein